MALTPAQKRLKSMKARQGLGKRHSLSPVNMGTESASNVTIEDIEWGGWSYIGQPVSPLREPLRKPTTFDFL